MNVKALSDIVCHYNEENHLNGRIEYSFEINQSASNSVSLMNWQPSGEIDYSDDVGYKCSSADHFAKASAFIALAKSEEASIALTAEYSFPFQLLEEIVNDSQRWPTSGKIWCLAMEGIGSTDYRELLEKLGQTEGVVILNDSDNVPHYKRFVSCLFYIFVSGDSRLILLPQYKIQHSGDKLCLTEAQSMSCGKSIYIIDHQEQKTHSLSVSSILCSDALLNLLPLKNYMKENSAKQFILLHPQLNPKPNHDQIYKQYLDMLDTYVKKVVALNWDAETRIVMPKPQPTAHSGGHSTLFLRGDSVATEEQIEMSAVNDFIHYFCDRHTGWISVSNEIAYEMQFRLECDGDTSNEMLLDAPVQFRKWIFNGVLWEKIRGCDPDTCIISRDWMGIHEKYFNLAFCKSLGAAKCPMVVRLDDIFSTIWFGDVWNEHYAARGRNSLELNRTILKSDNISRAQIDRKKNKFNYLLETLSGGTNMPKWLKLIMNGDYKFKVNAGYNIITMGQRARILFSSCEEGEIDHEELKGRIVYKIEKVNEDVPYWTICYYQSPEGYKWFDLRTKSITAMNETVSNPVRLTG